MALTQKPRIRLALCGLGAVGRAVARVAVERGHVLVGALDSRIEERADTTSVEISDRMHIQMMSSVHEFCDAQPDVVVHTTPRDSGIKEQILGIVEARYNVVSVSGIAHLWRQEPAFAKELDAAARDASVSVIGTGVNPGFMLDLVPVFVSGACTKIERIRARRVADLSPWGKSVGEMYGLGLEPDVFAGKVDSGQIGLQRELLQCVDIVADALRWELDGVIEKKGAIIASSAREASYRRIEGGKVCGFRHIAVGKSGSRSVTLEMLAAVQPAEDGLEVETTVEIQGEPGLEMTISGGAARDGDIVTAARVVNLLPWMIEAPPGLLKLSDIPVGVAVP